MTARSTGRIMLVGPDPHTRARLRAWLTDRGHAVESFDDLEPCFAMLLSRPPDLLLVDLALPGVPSLARRMTGAFPALPVLLLAGRVGGRLDDALAGGAWDYVQMPVGRQRLLVTVDNALELRRLRRSLHVRAAPESGVQPANNNGGDVRTCNLAEMERRAITDAMERTGGNVAEVVRQLGIGRTTVYRKLKKYGIR